MDPFVKMLQDIQSLPEYDRMVRFTRLLENHFGIGHFWYSRISNQGAYSYLGSNPAWDEYAFENQLHKKASPCISHPNLRSRGLHLDGITASEEWQEVLDTAQKKFNLHFSLTLANDYDEGVEQIGFATLFPNSEEKLLNELPLLQQFIKEFKKRHSKLLQTVTERAVDLPTHLGPTFYTSQERGSLSLNRLRFLRELGCQELSRLTPREKDLLSFLASGFPSSYIKDQLNLSVRTVENYIAALKEKLDCDSKTALIQKAQELLPFLRS